MVGEKLLLMLLISFIVECLVRCLLHRKSYVLVLIWSGSNPNLKYYKACDYHMGVSCEAVERIKCNSGHADRVFLGYAFGTLPQDEPFSRKEFEFPITSP